MTTKKFAFTLNGTNLVIEAEPERSLLKVLREGLHLTGTKCGCDGGQCGACSVLVNGKLELSCVTPILKVNGQEITTIEGLGEPGKLHPIQEAFVETGAIQCGFCTPGMILATKALLDRNPDPTLEEIKKGLIRNLCRCTGYVKIFDAVRSASQRLRGSLPPVREVFGKNVVGKSIPMLDAPAKVKGLAKYGDDLTFPDMLYAKTVRSPHAHAEIIKIETTEALATPGLRAILTAKDIEGPNSYGRFVKDQPVLCGDRVRFVGDPVALVIAETPDQAERASAQVKVHYKPLAPVFEAREALKDGAPFLYPAGNVCSEKKMIVGDMAKGFSESDVVVQRTYTTHFAEHAYLEPEAGVGYIDEEGRIVVTAGTQSGHFTQSEVAYALGLEKARVRIIQTTTGGGYGGKHDVAIHCLLALAALKLRRPVKILYTRRESMATTAKRHPFLMDLKMGANKDGALCAMKADYIANTGAYTGSGPGVFTRALLHATGPFHFPNVDISVTGVFTNNPSAGGMRGFGAPQVALALECQLDEIAHRIGIDPWEIRYRNAYTADHTLPTGHKISGNVEIRRCLEVIKPDYDAMKAEVEKKNKNSHGVRYGVGLATTMYGIGQSGILFPSRVKIYLEADGQLVVRVGVADVGQGTITGLAQIAADELQIPFEKVKIFCMDTLTEPDSGPSAASRQIFFTGNVLCTSLRKLKKIMLDAAPRIFGKECETLALDYSDEGAMVSPDGDRSRALPIYDFVMKANRMGVVLMAEDIYNPGLTYYDHKTQKGQPYPAYTYAAQILEVSINAETGEVQVPRVVVAQDVGRAINPKMVQGQLEGSILMGIGWALKEKFLPGKTESFATYPIPRSNPVPEMKIILIEGIEPGAPFGAKGVGESAMVPTAPAILNAIANATGIRLSEVPIDAQHLVRDGKRPFKRRKIL